MTKTVLAVLTTVMLIPVLAAAGVLAALSAVFGGGASRPSDTALADIPADYLALYQQAATICPGLDWSILAAIGKVETNHGRLNALGVTTGSNPAGAQGPMQFLPATFAAYDQPIPPGGNNPPSPYNPVNAIYAAVRYLCASGARDGRDLYGAIFAYNRADWYVRKVLDQAEKYRTAQAHLPQASGWTVPAQGRCTSGFGPRDGNFHQGQDIAAPIGTLIVAASNGTVLDSGPASGYGLWIRIQHPAGVVTTYGHNNRNLVRAGEIVQPGQPIAEVGSRGESTGPHLHLQIDINNQAVEPVRFYQQHLAPALCN
jgi:murein DD-endopeptidase MepM/ murein hydrolase activator NlpD